MMLPGPKHPFPDCGSKGEAFCRSYLDRCTVEGTTLIVATDYAIGKLREVANIMKARGFTGMRKR